MLPVNSLATTVAALKELQTDQCYVCDKAEPEDLDALFKGIIEWFHHGPSEEYMARAGRDEIDWLVYNMNILGQEGPSCPYEDCETPKCGNFSQRVSLLMALGCHGVGFPYLRSTLGSDMEGNYYTVGMGIPDKIRGDAKHCREMWEVLLADRKPGISF